MTFDPGKPVKTRDGRKAEIVVSNLNNNSFPILAIVTERDGSQWGGAFDRQGRSSGVAHGGSINDLVNESERTTFWGNVYNEPNGIPYVIRLHRRRDLCEAVSAPDRAGLISMTFDGGRLVSFENHDVTGSGK